MLLPHEPEFRWRAFFFWGLSGAALVWAWRTPGLELRTFGLAVLGATALSWIGYRYSLWIARLEGRFRHAHPRKYRATVVASFYIPAVLAIASAVLAPWLPVRGAKEPIGQVIGLLLVPVFLAGAAGALRGAQEPATGRPTPSAAPRAGRAAPRGGPG